MSGAKRRVAITGYYGHDNTGDEALLKSILRYLAGCRGVANVLVLTSRPEATARLHGVPAVEALLPVSIKDFFIRALGRNRLNFFRDTLRALSCNTLIVGGGGLFYDTPADNRGFLGFIGIVRLYQLLGKDVYLVGVSARPLVHEASRRAFAKLVRSPRTRLVVCRDDESAQLFRQAKGSDQDIFVTEDIVFTLLAQRPEGIVQRYRPESGAPMIGLSLCGPELSAEGAYRTTMRAFVQQMVARGVHMLLIPMSVGVPDDRSSMVNAFADFIAAGQVQVVTEDLTVDQNLALLGAMDCVVAERLHASILAVVGGTPPIGISYSAKVQLLFDHLGKQDWCRDKASLTAQWLTDAVTAVLEDQERARAEVGELREKMAANARQTFRILDTYLGEEVEPIDVVPLPAQVRTASTEDKVA